jgi:hypothetical protein
MTQIVNVTRLILERLVSKYQSHPVHPPTVSDCILADNLIDRYEDLFNSEDYTQEYSLDFRQGGFCEFDYDDEIIQEDLLIENSSQETESSQDWEFLQFEGGESFELQFIRKVLNYYCMIP